MSKYGDFSGSYFLVFSPNTGKYGPEKSPYFDTFYAVQYVGENLLTKGPNTWVAFNIRNRVR